MYNKRYDAIKTEATTWSYQQGKLIQSVDGKVVHTMTATNTLALVNLLLSNYKEIAECAVAEMRTQELEADRRRAHGVLVI